MAKFGPSGTMFANYSQEVAAKSTLAIPLIRLVLLSGSSAFPAFLKETMEPPYGQDEEFLGQKYEFEGDVSGFEVVQCINYTLVNEHGSTMDRLKMYNYMYIYIYINLYHMGVSENGGTPKSSMLIGFSIINHPFWGTTIFGNHVLLNMAISITSHVSLTRVVLVSGVFGWP